jgi:hypothetical protein
VLAAYRFHLGASGRLALTCLDPRIGRSGTPLRGTLPPAPQGPYHLRCAVFRHVPPAVIAFALLLERIA